MTLPPRGAPTEPEEETGVEHYIRFLRRHALVTAGVALLVLGSSLFFSYRQQPIYTSEARLLILPVPALGETGAQSVNLATEAELVGSIPVAELVTEDLDLSTEPGALLGAIKVLPRPGAEVLSIAYSHPDAEFAPRIANSFARSYLEFRQQQALDTLDAVRAPIEKEIRQVSADLERLEADIKQAEASGSALLGTLEQERNILIARLGVLQQRLSDFDPAKALTLGGGRIIEPATQSAQPSSPNHQRDGVLGLILGVALGLGLALLRDRMDTRFTDRWDIIRATRAPIIATVPVYPSRKGQQVRLIVLDQPTGAASEAYRNLRTAVQFIGTREGIKSFLVTSPLAGEGKSSATANLGLLMAQAGLRVILLSADLRKPSLHANFGLPNTRGLSNWLMSADTAHWPLIQDPGIPNLRLISSGPVPPNPAELLSSARLSRVIREIEEECDFLLVDSAPVLAVTDSVILAERCGGTLLLLNSDTPKPAAVHAREQLERVGAHIVGTVLNAYESETASYYYSEYGPGPGAPTIPPPMIGPAVQGRRTASS